MPIPEGPRIPTIGASTSRASKIRYEPLASAEVLRVRAIKECKALERAHARQRGARRRGRVADAAVQGGILLQDRALKLLQHPAGLKAQLLPQQLARLPVDRQRVGLAPRSIQRDHQLPDDALAQWIPAHQHLELPHQPYVLAERQLRVDSVLHGGESRLPKPGDLAPREGLVGEVSQWLPTPQRQPLAQAQAGSCCVARRERVSAAGRQRLKAANVNLLASDREPVTMSPRHDHILAKQLAQL